MSKICTACFPPLSVKATEGRSLGLEELESVANIVRDELVPCMQQPYISKFVSTHIMLLTAPVLIRRNQSETVLNHSPVLTLQMLGKSSQCLLRHMQSALQQLIHIVDSMQT